MLYILYICLLVNISSCLENEVTPETQLQNLQNFSDSVLCRYCGSHILKTDSIITKLSPISLHSFNDTVFNNEEVLIQILSNRDLVLQFPIITSTNTACRVIGEWEEDDYWFPGYHWKTCVCSECGAFLGWIFEPTDSLSVIILDQFFGLLVPQLASQSCKYSFTFFGIGQNKTFVLFDMFVGSFVLVSLYMFYSIVISLLFASMFNSFRINMLLVLLIHLVKI